MKKLSIVVLTSLIALFGFQPQGEAAGQVSGTAAPEADNKPNYQKANPPPQLAKDSRCEIQVFRDAAGTQPLPNNYSTTNMGANVWVRASVHNTGPGTATAFSSAFQVKRDGASVHASSPEFTVPGGYSMMFPTVKVMVGREGMMEASLAVDVNEEVTETSGSNNSCSFKVTSTQLN